ncbi:MAG: phosphonoacetaldehyde reductase [bacterium]
MKRTGSAPASSSKTDDIAAWLKSPLRWRGRMLRGGERGEKVLFCLKFTRSGVLKMNEIWQFYNPVRICFDSLEKISELVPGGPVLLVTTPGSSRRGVSKKIANLLSGLELEIYDAVTPNPSFQQLEEIKGELPVAENLTVIGLGGGSAMDSAKALSILLHPRAQNFSLAEYLKKKTSLPELEPLSLITVPTTAGTGGEVTPFATIWDEVAEKKYSLASEKIFARAALLDPRLTLTLPEEVTVSGALDTLSQCLESLWNRNAQPPVCGWATEGIKLVLEYLLPLLSDSKNLECRSLLQRASLYSGLAISQTRTALAHSISYPLTAHYGLPHGLACGFTLPALLQFNSQVKLSAEHPFERLPAELDAENHLQLAGRIEELFREIDLRSRLERYLPAKEKVLELTGEMYTPGRADNNIREADSEDIRQLLAASL